MLAGESPSVAVFVTVKSVSSAMTRLVCAGNTDATFTSVTMTVKLFVALRAPSLTTVVKMLVVGPCASVGVQVITPLAEILAPDGGLMS